MININVHLGLDQGLYNLFFTLSNRVLNNLSYYFFPIEKGSNGSTKKTVYINHLKVKKTNSTAAVGLLITALAKARFITNSTFKNKLFKIVTDEFQYPNKSSNLIERKNKNLPKENVESTNCMSVVMTLEENGSNHLININGDGTHENFEILEYTSTPCNKENIEAVLPANGKGFTQINELIILTEEDDLVGSNTLHKNSFIKTTTKMSTSDFIFINNDETETMKVNSS